MQSNIALGFCPIYFTANKPFQFISARAVYTTEKSTWVQIGNPSTVFPPSGTFFVPCELIPDSFQGPGGNVAAWVLEDQSDWQDNQLGARFRAYLLRQPPAEIIKINISSLDVDAIQKLLVDDGIPFPVGLTGRQILIEFNNGILAGPFDLFNHVSTANKYVCKSTALLNPVHTWPTQGKGTVPRIVLSWNDRPRIFASEDPLPEPQGNLLLAPLEELLRRANLAGGVGSQRRIIITDVTKHIASLQQALVGLPVNQISETILQRLQPLIDRAQLSSEAQMALDEYLAKHPIFDQSVQKKVDHQVSALRDSIRMEILGQEVQLQDAVDNLAKKHEDEIQRLAQELQHEQQQADIRRQKLQSELTALQKEKEELCRSVNVLDQKSASPYRWKTSGVQAARVLNSPNEAVEHLSKNLSRLGLLPAAAKNTAREAYIAACLGQMLLFQGSFALSMARAVAQSLAGNCVHDYSVPVGLISPLSLPAHDPHRQISVVIIEGINRSCFDSYSGELAILLEERCLGLRTNADPIVIGTLLDAPSSVPPSSTLLSCGPVFSTDHLSWKANLRAEQPIPGKCVAAAWKLDPRPFDANSLLPDNRLLSLRGRRNVAAAGALLAGLTSSSNTKESAENLDASLLFGWICPSLRYSERDYSEVITECRQRWEAAVEKDPQRLERYLNLDSSKRKS